MLTARLALSLVLVTSACASTPRAEPDARTAPPAADDAHHAEAARALAATHGLELTPPAGFTFAAPIAKDPLRSDITMRSDDGHIELWTWLWGMGQGLPQLPNGNRLLPTFTMSAILNFARVDVQDPTSAVQAFADASADILAAAHADEAVFGVFEPGPQAVEGRCCAVLAAWHKRGVGVIFTIAFMDIDDAAVSERAFEALRVLHFR